MLDESIDRGNFRRRISELISFGALTDLGETRSEGRGRPTGCIVWIPIDFEGSSIQREK